MTLYDRFLIAFSFPLGFLFGALAMSVAALFAIGGEAMGSVFLIVAGFVIVADHAIGRLSHGFFRRLSDRTEAEITRLEQSFAQRSRLSRFVFVMGFAVAVGASLIWSVETVAGFATVLWPA
ncbi:hypothetical protein [Lutimaribacter saemankumensis]|uniref:Uncharacterized protein n=1 Tax=Lutimaribacter saemankumensis TaxID=490829 RepID=A0A1G8L1U0_9RHOB|nr:hypothetical protein [Lutimaribacter saemankumensis]SDI49581.1 hypothetical protein SAMN05421850_103137 [Lutimaribacter saemankumensis]